MHSVLFRILALFILVMAHPAHAAGEKVPVCSAHDRDCLARQIETLTPSIERQEWQDQTYRELAKTYAYDGKTDKAIALIGKIKNPDTQAMTIRGIGMAVASLKWDRGAYTRLFTTLAERAAQISHGPSQGIAFTYIAMAQAFAGDDDGARATAAAMSNAALRNKAYGETAEIQAERGDLPNALKSLSAIQASSFRNKAYDTVSKIFIDKAMVEAAYECATKIDNAYLRTKALQRILNKGNAEEESVEPTANLAEPTE